MLTFLVRLGGGGGVGVGVNAHKNSAPFSFCHLEFGKNADVIGLRHSLSSVKWERNIQHRDHNIRGAVVKGVEHISTL